MNNNNSQYPVTQENISAHSKEPSVCIIGAGIGGINAASALKKQGIEFDCFDKRSRIGGIWDFDPKKEHTSVWSSLNMNTPQGIYQFSDFPMPDSYPDFPAHHQVHAYIENYIDHCGIRDSIHLNTEVSSAERLDNGTWIVTLGSGEVRKYAFLVVANGHHNTPNYPDYPGHDTFNGDSIHSRFYRYRHEYKNKRVMVVGIGNSGSQIAVDVSHDAKMTYMALRRGVYVIPHYMFGIRIDKVLGCTLDWWFKKLLPHPLYGLFFTGLYNLLVAKHSKMGMPKPDHLMMSSLPTVSEGLPNRIGDGKIKIVPDVKHIDGNTVHLADGSSIEVDSIIYATGFQTTFPFLNQDFLSIRDNYIPLYKRIFMPRVKNIAFIGVFQAITWGFLDIMEKQAKVVAEYLSGGYRLPSIKKQCADIEREKKVIKREFLSTLRNNYEMHGDTYKHQLDQELKRGLKRAKSANFARPIWLERNSELKQANDNPTSSTFAEMQ